MRQRNPIDTAAPTLQPQDGAKGGGLRLLVFSGGAVHSHALPRSGRLTIGRSSNADIAIDDPSVSREHATLEIGSNLTITDLGSANGTRVRQNELRAHEPVIVRPSDAIEVGSTVVLIQSSGTTARPKQTLSPAEFESRLRVEIGRSDSSGGKFAIMAIRVGGAPRPLVLDTLSAALQRVDALSSASADTYELLLADAGRLEVDHMTRRLTSELSGDDRRLSFGVAYFPADGRAPDALLTTARSRLRGSRLEEAAGTTSENETMQRLYQLVERIAASDISVLLLGETGVGKEYFAQTIHRRSLRSRKAFVGLNCAALSESLLESELFGHERGAFTGAIQAKAGLFEAANGGTLFLDEAGELPMSTQAKLLRVLENRQVRRVGGLESRSIDVRFISATNRDLEREVAHRAFREDLFFRLNGISVVIPPLRERVSEIRGLAEGFVADICKHERRHSRPAISAEALALLQGYRWPGNIRELRNMMERALLMCDDGPILPAHLPVQKMSDTPTRQPPSAAPATGPGTVASPASAAPPAAFAAASATPAPAPTPDSLRQQLEETERAQIIAALEQCAGNQTQAAKLLGISRRTLVNKLDRYNLPRPRGKQPK